MNTIIKIEKEDIVTSRLGMNVEIKISPNTSLVFTTEALDELVKDYAVIKEEIHNTTSQIVESLRTARDFSQLEFEFEKGGDWICNECNAKEYTSSISEEDILKLQCSSCGCDEFHRE